MSAKHLDDMDVDESWPLLGRFREHALPHAHYLAVSLVAIVLNQVVSTSVPTVIGVSIDAIFNDQPYDLPFVPGAWIPTAPVDQLWFTGALLAAIYVAQFPLGFAANYFRGLFSSYVRYDFKLDAYATVQDLELAFFDEQQTGEVLSILNNDVDELEDFFNDGIAHTLAGMSALVATAGYMAVLNRQLTAVAFVLGPLFWYVTYRFSGRFEEAWGRAQQAYGKMTARFEDNVGGIEVIKANTTEPAESERVREASYETFRAYWSAMKLGQTFNPVIQFLTNGTYLLTLAVGGYWVIRGAPGPLSGTLTAGELVPFLLYTQQISGHIGNLANQVETYKSAKASANRVATIQRTDLTIEEREDARELDRVDGRVEYDDVTFAYGERGAQNAADADEAETASRAEPVLTDVSFAVEPGETVGLVGSTGAGKSTLTKLLLRFYDVDEGAIRVDGRDVRDVTVESLRENVGYVAQEPYLFSGTVRENVAYGSREADRREASDRASGDGGPASPEATDREVREAAKAARAHAFIERLEDGYDTEVGGRGVRLSGGQRQRIAIARALVRDPPILIFDEATSHVDNETEVLIQRSLAEVTDDKTTFVVAHRLSTVRNADTILVLDDGEIVERGTHEELLDEDGIYATLWGVQVGRTDLSVDLVEGSQG